MDKYFKVKTKIVFSGDFYVFAKDKQQARDYIEKHCGLVIGGDIHSTLPDDMIDWNFDVHSDKLIISIKEA